MLFLARFIRKKNRDINELLSSVELLKDSHKKISEFSKGMKSRLNFIKALLHDPNILFLDEPTSGLDPTNSRIMKDLILAEKAKGKTIILTTHNMEDATELCDRVAFIVNGKVKALDKPHNLIMQKGAKQIKYSYVDNGKEIINVCYIYKTSEDEIFAKLIAENKLLSVHSSEPNLGDIFMDITGRNLI